MFTDVAYVHISSPPDTDFLCRYDPRLASEPRKSFPNCKSSSNFGAICAKPQRKTSSVMGQKLRESKWFTHEELKILCAVLESGFIVQKSRNDEEDQWGIALWNIGYEKSKDPEYVTIHTLVTNKKKPEIQGLRLMDFWTQGAKLKINNQADQTTTPLTEDEIRNQISYAESIKKKWHNSEHFSYWCRYTKTHNISLINGKGKWYRLGLTAGLQLLRSRKKHASTPN